MVDSKQVASKSSIFYHLCLGLLNSLKRIKTNIAYFRTSQPPPASQMRRGAYEAGALLPSPMNDPEGWFAMPTVTIPGVVKTDDGNLLYTSVDCKVIFLIAIRVAPIDA
jgi:hypothetical protein